MDYKDTFPEPKLIEDTEVSPESLTYIARLNRMAKNGFRLDAAEQALAEQDRINKEALATMGLTDYISKGMAAGLADLQQQAGGLGQILGMAGASSMAEEARRVQAYVTPDFDPQEVDGQPNPYETPSFWQRMAFLTGRATTGMVPAMGAMAGAGAAIGGAVTAGALTGTQGFAAATGAAGLVAGLQSGTQTYDEWLAKTGDEALATRKGIQSMMAAGAINAAGGAIAGKWMGNATTERLFNGMLKDTTIREKMKALGKNVAVQSVTGVLDQATQNLVNELPAGFGVMDAAILSAFIDPTNFQLLGRSGVQLLRGNVGKEPADVALPTADPKLAQAVADSYDVDPNTFDPNSPTDAILALSADVAAKAREQDAVIKRYADVLMQEEAGVVKAEADDAARLQAEEASARKQIENIFAEPPDDVDLNAQHFNALSKDRLPIEPLTPEQMQQPVRPFRDVVKDLKDNLKANTTQTTTERGGVLGYYSHGDQGMRVPRSDFDTLAHELGHKVSFNSGFVPPEAMGEVTHHFSPTGSPPPEGATPERVKYVTEAEGMAEFIRAYALSPEGTKKVAPNAVKFLESALTPNELAALQRFGVDVRRHYHGTAMERMKSQVWSPEQTPSVFQRLKDFLTNPQSRRKELGALSTYLEHTFVDDDVIEVKAVKALEDLYGKIMKGKGQDLTFSQMGSSWIPIIRTGHRDAPYLVANEGGPDKAFIPVKDVIGVLDRNNLQADLKDATAYAIAKEAAKRWVEKVDPANPNNVFKKLTGSGGGMHADIEDAAKVLKEVAADPAKQARYDAYTQKITEYFKGVTDYLHNAGLISDELHKKVMDNPSYTPLKRLLEITPGDLDNGTFLDILSSGDVDVASGSIKPFFFQREAKGSSAPIIDPVLVMLNVGAQAIRVADKYRFVRSLVDIAKKLSANMPDFGRPDSVLSDFMTRVWDGVDTIPKNAPVISVPDTALDKNGNVVKTRSRWLLNKRFADALDAMVRHETSSELIRQTAKVANVLRAGIIYTPAYFVRNVIRDTLTRFIQTGGVNPTEYFMGMSKAQREKAHSDLRRFGVTSSGVYHDVESYYDLQTQVIKDLSTGNNLVIPLGTKLSNLWSNYKRVAANSELFSRIPEYQNALNEYLKKNPSHSMLDAKLYAANQALELIDFNRAGRIMRDLNRITPFVNVQIQSLRRTYKTAMQDPRGVVTRAFLAMAMVKGFFYALNYASGDMDEYLDQPAYMRDMFGSVKLGDNTWLRVPLPFDYAVLGSFFERAISQSNGVPNAWEGYGRSLASAFFPFDEGTIAGPFRGVLELAANHDFFRDSNIIPPSEAKLKLSLRPNTDKASALARIGQDIMGVDARYIEHGVKAGLGTAGVYASALSDVLDFTNKERQGRALAEFPLTLSGVLGTSPAFGSPDVQYVMNTAAELGLQNETWYRYFMLRLRESLSVDGGRALIDERKKVVRDLAADLRKQLKPYAELKGKAKETIVEAKKELK